MCLVPTTDDPGMVVWHVPMVGRQPRLSLAIIPLHSSAGLPTLYGGCGAGLRDVRDRMARRSRRWRDVCFAGMAGGDHMALVLVSHEGIDRREVQDVLRRRWPDVVVKSWSRSNPPWQCRPPMLPISVGAVEVSSRCGS